MSYTVGKLLTSGVQWTRNYPARYLSKGIKSLYFDVANIKRYTVSYLTHIPNWLKVSYPYLVEIKYYIAGNDIM